METRVEKSREIMEVASMSNGDGGNSGLAFIVGGLVVAVALIAYFVFNDGISVFDGGDSTTVSVDASSGNDAGSGQSSGAADTPSGGAGENAGSGSNTGN